MNQEIRTCNIQMKIKAALFYIKDMQVKNIMGYLTTPSDGETEETGSHTLL